MEDQITWANGKRKLGELVPWERNPRHIKDKQAETLADSFHRYGQVETFAIGPNNEVYDGHQRLKILLDEHGPNFAVDVRISSRALTEKERERLVIYLHKGATGEWDKEMLLQEFEFGDLIEWGFKQGELQDIGFEVPGSGEEDDAGQMDIADQLQEKWQIKPGDIYSLGAHRIMCGDATDPADYEKLMRGEKAQICWTDPPWNVAYGTNIAKDNPQNYRKREINNDNLGDRFPEFVRLFTKQIYENLVPGGIIYCVMSAQEWGVIMPAMEFAGFHWSSTIIWVKNALVLSRKDYHTQYEPMYYGWKIDAARVCRVEDRKQSDTWMIDRPKRSDEHPTMKPLELIERSLRNSTRANHIVLEPFSGSGSTLIAAERTKRICRAMDNEPKYVAVAVQRWADVTGGTPEKIS